MTQQANSLFDGIRHVKPNGKEFWSARELMPVLGYNGWQRAEGVIEKAMEACVQSGNVLEDHFNTSVKMVSIGSGAERELKDYHLSRLGAYLTAMNCDPRNRPQVAAAQLYFTVKTRQQELHELKEAQKQRVELRQHVTELNKKLVDAAQDAGVPIKRMGVFQDEGYKGLYGGLGSAEIKKRKKIPAKQNILDRMGSVELGANIFRITQTEDKLKKGNVKGEEDANSTHREMGRKVRDFIKQEGNTLPEDLPPEPDIKPLIDQEKQKQKKVEESKTPDQLSMFSFDDSNQNDESGQTPTEEV